METTVLAKQIREEVKKLFSTKLLKVRKNDYLSVTIYYPESTTKEELKSNRSRLRLNRKKLFITTKELVNRLGIGNTYVFVSNESELALI